MYCHTEKNNDIVLEAESKLKTFEYNNKTKQIILESESSTYTVNKYKWESINSILNGIGVYDTTGIIEKFYNNSKFFATFIKHIKKRVGIYFHCISFEYFIEFLQMADFSDVYIQFFKSYELRLSKLSFEIAMDYDTQTKTFTRFAFYGSF